jgi:hypothetical protein
MRGNKRTISGGPAGKKMLLIFEGEYIMVFYHHGEIFCLMAASKN